MSDKAKKAIISGTACLLLVMGFAAGFFTNRLFNKPQEEVPPQILQDNFNSTLLNYWVNDSNSISYSENLIQQITATQAKSMSTNELINLATQIPELITYTRFTASSIVSSVIIPMQLDPQDFDNLKQTYPVLAELEPREDAALGMRIISMQSSSSTYKTKVLSLLMTLDIFQWDGEFLYETTDDIIINIIEPLLPVDPIPEDE